MSHYWKKCPHCGHTVEDGYGLSSKRFGNPKKQCRFCLNTYIDRDVIDWESASIFKKFLYCLSNGRFFICLIPSIIVNAQIHLKTGWKGWRMYLICSSVFLIMFALCLLYVKLQVLLHYGSRDKEKKKKKNLEDPYAKYKNDPFGIKRKNDRK